MKSEMQSPYPGTVSIAMFKVFLFITFRCAGFIESLPHHGFSFLTEVRISPTGIEAYSKRWTYVLFNGKIVIKSQKNKDFLYKILLFLLSLRQI